MQPLLQGKRPNEGVSEVLVILQCLTLYTLKHRRLLITITANTTTALMFGFCLWEAS